MLCVVVLGARHRSDCLAARRKHPEGLFKPSVVFYRDPLERFLSAYRMFCDALGVYENIPPLGVFLTPWGRTQSRKYSNDCARASRSNLLQG